MMFAYPWVLLGLTVPLVLVVAEWSGRRHTGRARLPFEAEAPKRQRVLSAFIAIAQLGAPMLLVAAILILAGPRSFGESKRTRELTNIQILLDVSGSMRADSPRRYDIASNAIERFTHAREGDAIGLTTFGESQLRWVPITKDLEAIRLALPFADPDLQPRGMSGTAIGAALYFAADAMDAEAVRAGSQNEAEGGVAGERIIILVSDGMSRDLDGGRHLDVADRLIVGGITLYYLHIGSGLHEPAAYEIASLTGGRGFLARDAATFSTVFATLDTMTKSSFRSEAPKPREFLGPFVWMAVGAAGLQLLGLLGLRYTPW